MTLQQTCHFCEIVANTEPARIVMRNAHVVAFFPQEPATVGHTLVIPTDHIADIWELDETTAVNLTRYSGGARGQTSAVAGWSQYCPVERCGSDTDCATPACACSA